MEIIFWISLAGELIIAAARRSSLALANAAADLAFLCLVGAGLGRVAGPATVPLFKYLHVFSWFWYGNLEDWLRVFANIADGVGWAFGCARSDSRSECIVNRRCEAVIRFIVADLNWSCFELTLLFVGEMGSIVTASLSSASNVRCRLILLFVLLRRLWVILSRGNELRVFVTMLFVVGPLSSSDEHKSMKSITLVLIAVFLVSVIWPKRFRWSNREFNRIDSISWFVRRLSCMRTGLQFDCLSKIEWSVWKARCCHFCEYCRRGKRYVWQ